mmetsp:Transcript_28201/g.45686  ORF Transcript_28201/g.45686 Transcript_28201/m.45686 type:complete len:841 (+) Transcript_28201:84-2606(+)
MSGFKIFSPSAQKPSERNVKGTDTRSAKLRKQMLIHDKSQTLIDDFSCQQQKDGGAPKQGRIYLFDDFVGFKQIDSILHHKNREMFSISLKDIKDISKTSVHALFSKAILVELMSGQKITLGGFFYRDEVYDRLGELWNVSRGRKTNNSKKDGDNGLKDQPQPPVPVPAAAAVSDLQTSKTSLLAPPPIEVVSSGDEAFGDDQDSLPTNAAAAATVVAATTAGVTAAAPSSGSAASVIPAAAAPVPMIVTPPEAISNTATPTAIAAPSVSEGAITDAMATPLVTPTAVMPTPMAPPVVPMLAPIPSSSDTTTTESLPISDTSTRSFEGAASAMTAPPPPPPIIPTPMTTMPIVPVLAPLPKAVSNDDSTTLPISEELSTRSVPQDFTDVPVSLPPPSMPVLPPAVLETLASPLTMTETTPLLISDAPAVPEGISHAIDGSDVPVVLPPPVMPVDIPVSSEEISPPFENASVAPPLSMVAPPLPVSTAAVIPSTSEAIVFANAPATLLASEEMTVSELTSTDVIESVSGGAASGGSAAPLIPAGIAGLGALGVLAANIRTHDSTSEKSPSSETAPVEIAAADSTPSIATENASSVVERSLLLESAAVSDTVSSEVGVVVQELVDAIPPVFDAASIEEDKPLSHAVLVTSASTTAATSETSDVAIFVQELVDAIPPSVDAIPPIGIASATAAAATSFESPSVPEIDITAASSGVPLIAYAAPPCPPALLGSIPYYMFQSSSSITKLVRTPSSSLKAPQILVRPPTPRADAPNMWSMGSSGYVTIDASNDTDRNNDNDAAADQSPAVNTESGSQSAVPTAVANNNANDVADDTFSDTEVVVLF